MHPAHSRVRLFTITIALAGLAGGLLSAFAAPPGAARAAAAIVVDSTATALGVAGCTLPEAILAANHDASLVPHPDGRSADVDTGCAAGSGSDTIWLAVGATYTFNAVVDDAANYVGPTATPIITSNITIEGQGAVIRRSSSVHFRAFAVQGTTAHLDLREVHVKDFSAKGGNGASGGGGGLGAGGAIYVLDGSLLVQWSTFEANGATGGNGAHITAILTGGGGGGLGGDGGASGDHPLGAGGGGGGARGDGADGQDGAIGDGGGGGGTIDDGGVGLNENGFPVSRSGGYLCGGDGGTFDSFLPFIGEDGDNGCLGGGGGGGRSRDDSPGGSVTILCGEGGSGGYGGGGGGGGADGCGAGDGNFGGGGGGAMSYDTNLSGFGPDGGDGGFGAGGGAGHGGYIEGGPGEGGTFAGNADTDDGGGGAGLGGAIFGHLADILVVNSTFTRNYAVRGVAGGAGAQNGTDAGGAIFLVGGSLSINSSTIAGNESTGDGAGVVAYKPTTGDSATLSMYNTIVAGNTGHDECFVIGGVTTAGTNNLITPHPLDDVRTECPGITQTTDPQLGALALNAPGRTPTMALASTSPAIDAGDSDASPLDDQRGVPRPQLAGPDIGAFEFSSDTTPPTAPAPSLAPAANSDGWNNTDVVVTWNWIDDGAGIDPDACTLQTTSTGEGSAIVLTATCADLVGNVTTATLTVMVDKTAPTVTCAPTPTFVIGGTPTSGLSATVADALSGPAASPVTAAVSAEDVDEPGQFSKSLTGADVAGNTTTVNCEFIVGYAFSGFLQPIPQSSYKRGSTIPVRFQLGDASGVLSDADAAALLSPTCLVFVTLDGEVKGCAKYNATSNTFQFDVKTTKALATGIHSIGILVKTADGDVVNTDSVVVLLR